MMIQVLFFAQAREATGTASCQLNLKPGATVADVRQTLLQTYPALAAVLPHALIAVNRQYVPEALKLDDGAEVAIIPPVGGG